MKRGPLLRAAFAALLAIGLASAPSGESRAQEIDEETWSRFLEARALYVRHCSACHGFEGAEGFTPYAPGFALGEGLDREFGMLLLSIQQGAGLMPPWESILSYEEQDWILFYALALRGDNVFRKQCASCHRSSAPRLPASIPRGDDLAGYDGPIHVTRGTAVTPTWDAQEKGHVIRMLRALAEER